VLSIPNARASPFISLNPAFSAANGTVTVMGDGFTPGVSVTITFSGSYVASTSADDSGNINVAFNVPVVGLGVYTVSASDSGGAGSAYAPLTVIQSTETATPPSSSSPDTTGLPNETPETTVPEPTPINNSPLPTATPVTTALSITLNPTEASVGTGIAVIGSGFTPSGSITIEIDSTAVATGFADGFGSVNTVFTLPSLSAGAHQVTVLDSDSGRIATGSVVVSTGSEVSEFWSPIMIAALMGAVLAITIPLAFIAGSRRGHKKPTSTRDEKFCPQTPIVQKIPSFQQSLPPAPLPPPPPWLQPLGTEYETEPTDTCLFCGKPLIPNEKICPNCGERN